MTDESLIIRVREALKTVIDPKTGRNIVASGDISDLSVSQDGSVRFMLRAQNDDETSALKLLAAAKAATATVAGVSEVAAVVTNHISGAAASEKHRPAPTTPSHDNPFAINKRKASSPAETPLPHVTNVIAVASGKGGVGKSTFAANLAIALAQAGFTTGLLDADIYGPSVPTLLGLDEKPKMLDGKIVPQEAFGIKAMSVGLLVKADQALAWRGPMVMGAVRQLINDVAWGSLDVMIIDTPPGTGDVHLSLAQTKRLTGAVIVSTPQELALADVRRGVELFRKVNVPVLGVIENMAWFDAPDGNRAYLFGKDGAQNAATKMDVPFLGAVPIFQQLRETSDMGTPIVASAPDSAPAIAIKDIAAMVAGSLKRQPAR